VAILNADGMESAVDQGKVVVKSDDGAAISRALAAAGVFPSVLVPRTGRLEELFLSLTEGTP
jgi:hypothetical protein